MTEFPNRDREHAREGSRAGHELFGRHPRAAVPDRRGDQRRLPRRRRRDRAPLLRPDDLGRRPPLRLPGGVPRHLPGLGRDAADPAARRRARRRKFVVAEPDAAEPHARRARGARAGLRRPAARPREFLDESIAFALELVGRAASATPAGPRPTLAEVLRRARGQLDDSVHGAAPAPYRRARPDRGRGDAGRSRRATAREEDAIAELLPGPAGAGLALRVRPRRAAREEGSEPDAEPRRCGRSGSSARA